MRHCCRPCGGGDDNKDDVRWEEQTMRYADADALSRNQWQAEGKEGDVDDGSDNKYVDGRVRGPRQASTRDG